MRRAPRGSSCAGWPGGYVVRVNPSYLASRGSPRPEMRMSSLDLPAVIDFGLGAAALLYLVAPRLVRQWRARHPRDRQRPS